MAGIVYNEVNDALNAELLGGRFAGRPLYLALDNETRRAVAARLGIGEDVVEATCCRVVGRTLWPQGNPYYRHSRDLSSWQLSGAKEAPPFTALLFALAHAAELMAGDDQYSQTNYYQRLGEATRFVPQKLSLHGRFTEEFWHAFSSWLARSNYAHGRPTARQLPTQKYVSLAVSQAIVRAADREEFHGLFEKYGFTGADAVSGEEMGQYLAAWIHGATVGKRLKTAWSRTELRPRIAEVALAELEAWASRVESVSLRPGQGGGATRLSLVATLGGFPTRRLSLSLGRKVEGEGSTTVSAGDGSPSLELGNGLFGGFATLSPAKAVDVPGVLARGLSVAAADGSMRHEWRPRFVLPFARSPSGPYWTEAGRGVIGVEHMVLALDLPRTRDAVEAVLAEAALPGYSCATSSQLPGLPAGWLLYEGVRLMRPLASPPDAAADLSPIADAGGLRIDGGLRLAPGVWHRRSPPVIRFDGAPPGARLELRDGVDEQGPVVSEAQATNGWALLDLPKLELPASGELFARGLAGRGHEHVVSLLVRSARRPQPLDRLGRGQLAMTSLDGSVELALVGEALPTARGLAASGALAPPVKASALHSWPGINPGGVDEGPGSLAEEDLPAGPRPRTDWARVEDARTVPCGQRGFHWYLVETIPPGAPGSTPVAMACDGCGHAVLRNGGAKPKVAASSSDRGRPPPPPPPAPTPPRQGRVDMELLLDALSFMGSGGWGAFEALVAGGVDEPWEAAAIAQDLFALGHLDLRRKPGSGRILGWSVSPPVLALLPGGDAILSGFRNQPLLEALTTQVALAGGSLAVEARPAQPPVVRVAGLCAEALGLAVKDIRDPHGRELAVVDEAAARLAAACLAMDPPWTLLEPATLGRDTDLEAFDLQSCRWRGVEGSPGAGAYRSRSSGTRYFAKSADGTAHQGPHELVKLMAARGAGAALHAHDVEAETFLSVLGCEPPGLLRRVLVACTGVLPGTAAGQVHFPNVPAGIAATMLAILYPESLT